MKIDLIGFIFNTGSKRHFKGIISDGDRELSEHEILDFMIMEYAKVKNGGVSDVIVVRKLLQTAAS